VRFPLIAVLVAAVLATGAPGHDARAAPQLEVHARTELRLRPIRKDYGDVYVLSGTLVDRFSGEGIGGETVRLEVAGQRVSAVTGQDGTFEIKVRAPGGRQDIDVEFEGSALLEPSNVKLEDVDVDKNAVDLELSTTAAAGSVSIAVRASIAGAPVELPVTLFVGPADAAPETLTRVAQLDAGGAPFTLTRVGAGGPGMRRVRVVFAGDGTNNPAAADATVELATATTTVLAVRSTSVAFEDDAVATGRVLDEDGHPVARASVALIADGRRVATAVTRKDGAFRFAVEGATLGQGDAALQATVEPTEGWMRGSRSEVVHVTVAAPQPVPIAYTLAAFALTALVAGGFFAARTRPWQRFRRAAREEGERTPEDAPAEPTAGLVPGRASLVSTLRRAADSGVTGVVRDAIRHRPIDGAIVSVTLGEQTETLTTGADGSFAIENLAPGEWKVEVARAAHVTERFAITIPHRGELRGARIDLMPVRERIFTLYKRAALPLLPDPARWGVWSPRQVFDHVRRRRPARALADLTDFVEATYFAAEQPDESRLPDAETRVDAAIAEHFAV